MKGGGPEVRRVCAKQESLATQRACVGDSGVHESLGGTKVGDGCACRFEDRHGAKARKQVKASRKVAAPVRASAGASASVARRSVTVSVVSCAGFGAQDLMASMDMDFLARTMVADVRDSDSVERRWRRLSRR